MDYLILEWVHIVSSTILFGTGIGTAFFMFMANRRGEIAGIAFATRHAVIADWVFTTPAVIIQPVTGLWMLFIAQYSFSEPWIAGALALYVFAGACWLPVVWMQIKMRDMAQEALATGQPLPPIYWNMERWWTGLGCAAFSAIIVIFYLMIAKPG
ncbi:MAG: DUF2269 domain-containing protein [Alphaproteobacteria bacterium]|nr:DUF2269 domain-containing protein [Alphaproteobacteria bacterium]